MARPEAGTEKITIFELSGSARHTICPTSLFKRHGSASGDRTFAISRACPTLQRDRPIVAGSICLPSFVASLPIRWRHVAF